MSATTRGPGGPPFPKTGTVTGLGWLLVRELGSCQRLAVGLDHIASHLFTRLVQHAERHARGVHVATANASHRISPAHRVQREDVAFL
jgi:hypothetical protein